MSTINSDTRASALTKSRLRALINHIMDLDPNEETPGGGSINIDDGFELNEDGEPVEGLAVALFKVCNEMRIEIENLRLDTEDSYAYLKDAFGLDSDSATSQGPAGPKGNTGSQGPQGHKGKKGDKGVTGATGATGVKGAKGDTGATGAAGADGSDGAKGDKGDKGDTGATGAAGADGSNGSDGAAGAKGDKGDKGDTGATGADGKAGADGNSHLSSWTIKDQGKGILTISDGKTTWTITGGK